ncbi:MAG: L-seryl-tRNA(Sec) selenium transferase [Anaerolineae bacterium]
MTRDKLRQLPAVDALLQTELADALIANYGRSAVLTAIRATLDAVRQHILNGADDMPDLTPQHVLERVQNHLIASFMPTLCPVINATGVIIHTNLGRAPLSEQAQQAVQAISASYSNLEFNLTTGKRGSRYTHAEDALTELTGAEGALVVNNNAGALVLMLFALAQGQEVVISRSQLVEIGGGFRIPDIMAQSGAHLVEVGTTNRTRLSDYRRALSEQTAMLLRVHSSNFRIVGFVEETPLVQMASLAHEHGVCCVDDLGSGAFFDTELYGLLHEPTVQESVQAGADLVLFSGDKLLGGPQSGILIGRADLIAELKRHPLARALRADKLCYAGLSATLDHYRRGEALTKIPIWQMISSPLDALQTRAQAWRDALGQGQLLADQSTVGGGSLPGTTLPTVVLALSVPDATASASRLRYADQPIITRIHDDRLLFDPRTVLPQQDDLFLQALKAHL